MVVMAEAFLQNIERVAINTALQSNPVIEIKSYKRYVDDSHARFKNNDDANKFHSILNQLHPNIKYTIDYEGQNKDLNYLDISIMNQGNGHYEFKIYRKDAVTNVQIRPHSNHDPKTKDGVFNGFVHRAFKNCSQKYINEELKFLVDVFVENGYDMIKLNKIIENVKNKYNQPQSVSIENSANENIMQVITLPWIPGLSPKLRKIYRKAGYKTVFKSNANLKTLLTAKNKTPLPKNSMPGVYRIPCQCKDKYIGETKLKVDTRKLQHVEDTQNEKWNKSAIADHKRKCTEGVIWENTETVKIEPNRFDRKVREALQIQLEECGPEKGGMNQDNGQYVKTKFWMPYFKYLREMDIRKTSNNTRRISSSMLEN